MKERCTLRALLGVEIKPPPQAHLMFWVVSELLGSPTGCAKRAAGGSGLEGYFPRRCSLLPGHCGVSGSPLLCHFISPFNCCELKYLL